MRLGKMRFALILFFVFLGITVNAWGDELPAEPEFAADTGIGETAEEESVRLNDASARTGEAREPDAPEEGTFVPAEPFDAPEETLTDAARTDDVPGENGAETESPAAEPDFSPESGSASAFTPGYARVKQDAYGYGTSGGSRPEWMLSEGWVFFFEEYEDGENHRLACMVNDAGQIRSIWLNRRDLVIETGDPGIRIDENTLFFETRGESYPLSPARLERIPEENETRTEEEITEAGLKSEKSDPGCPEPDGEPEKPEMEDSGRNENPAAPRDGDSSVPAGNGEETAAQAPEGEDETVLNGETPEEVFPEKETADETGSCDESALREENGALKDGADSEENSRGAGEDPSIGEAQDGTAAQESIAGDLPAEASPDTEDERSQDGEPAAEGSADPDAGDGIVRNMEEPDGTPAENPEMIVPAEMVLGQNESAAIPVSFSDGNEYPRSLKTSSKSIAEVLANGYVKARKTGTAVITVTSEFGTASVTVRVLKAPEKLTWPASTIKLGLGENITLSADLPRGSAGKITYSASAPGIVDLAPDGSVTARSAGSVQVRAQTYNGKKAMCTVQVMNEPSELELCVPELLGTGMTDTASVRMDEGSFANVTYFSENPEIAEIDEKGQLKALAPGETVITVRAYNGLSDSKTVRVKDGPESLSLAEESIVLCEKDSRVFPEILIAGENPYTGTLSFSSSSKSVAAVGTDGTLKALKTGKTVITVRSWNGKTAKLTVNVKAAPSEIHFESSGLVLLTGEKEKPRIDSSNHVACTVQLSSSNPEVLAIGEDGQIEAVGTGSATLTAQSYNKKKACIPVYVFGTEEEIPHMAISGDVELGVNESRQIGVTFSDGKDYPVYCTSAKSSTAKVTESGRVTGLRAGSTVITVKSLFGTGMVPVLVAKAPGKVTTDCSSLKMGAGETREIRASLPSGTLGRITFTSANPEVVSVEDMGDGSALVTACGAGSAKITVQTYNGKKAIVQATVEKAPTQLAIRAPESMGVGQKNNAAIILGNGEGGRVRYSSDAENVLTADPVSGLLTAVAPGTAVITAETYNGLQSSQTVQVFAAPEAITLPVAGLELCEKDSCDFPEAVFTGENIYRGSLSYSFSKKNIVTIGADGRLYAARTGSTVITVSTWNGKTAKLSVTVKAVPQSISFDDTGLALLVGDRTAPKVITSNRVSCTLQLTSSDNTVLAIRGDGWVEAVGTGSVTLTAVSYNKKRASIPVSVFGSAEEIPTMCPCDCLNLGTGESRKIKAVFSDGKDYAVTYTSAKTSVAKVNENGTVTAVRAGSTEIVMKSLFGSVTMPVVVSKAPDKVSLGLTAVKMGIGETRQIQAVLPSGTQGKITFKSENPMIVSVQDLGSGTALLTAVRTGSAKISAKTYNGKTAVLQVTVRKAPSEFTITIRDSMGVGQEITVEVSMGSNEGGSVFFESDSSDVLEVDSGSGVLKAVGAGTAVITARTYNGLCDSRSVRVYAAPESMSVHPNGLILGIGDSHAFPEIILSGDNVYRGTFTYTSSSSRIVKVTSQGKITALQKGSCQITARNYLGMTVTISVNVHDRPKEISFENAPSELCVEEEWTPVIHTQENLSASTTLTSSDDTVLRVLADGKTVQAVSPGTAVITAVSYNKVSASAAIRVLNPPAEISLAEDSVSLGVGDSFQLKPVTGAGEGSIFSFEAEDSEIAAVDGQGKVTARKSGETRILVRSRNGLETDCALTVTEAPSRIRLNRTSGFFGTDEGPVQLEYTLGSLFEGGRLKWASSDPEVADVDENGLVTLFGPGETTVSVETYNGLKSSALIRVGLPPQGAAFEKTVYILPVGDSIQILPVFENGCESCTLTAGQEDVLLVDGLRITGLREAETALTLTTRSGFTAECVVQVIPEVTGIVLREHEIALVRGAVNSVDLDCLVEPNETGSVSYSSSDRSVAVVDADTGRVSITGFGKCVITATSYNGYTDSCEVTATGMLDGCLIGIDPGHQLYEDFGTEKLSPKSSEKKQKVSAGATGILSRVEEAVTNRQVSLKLRDMLEYLGAEVLLTREIEDVNISNRQRALMMNEAGVDFWLRIHCNGSKDKTLNGISTYSRSSCAYDKSVIPDPGQLLANEKQLSSLLSEEMRAITGAKNAGVNNSDAYVGNNWSTRVCVLVEMGYNSNKEEDAKLNNDEYQNLLARGMVNAICRYYGMNRPEGID